MPTLTANQKRTLFQSLLVICFFLSLYFKQYSVFYPEPFALVAFCGVIGILVDYASKIRTTSWFWLIPALLAVELTGTLISKAGFPMAANILYVPGAMIFLIYGLLFIWRGIRNRGMGKLLSLKYGVLGLMTMAISGWELITYFPYQFDKSHIGWRILYLAVFAWLLFIDFSTRFDLATSEDQESGGYNPSLKIERDVLRYSLFVIAAMYFDRFIFQ